MGVDPSQTNPSDPKQQASNQSQNSATGDESSGEVDVTEDIEKLIAYVKKKKEDDPHDTVLSRVHSRLTDIVEKLTGSSDTSTESTTPTTPSVTIPDLPQWKFVRKRGGRIVKKPVKQEVPK